MSSEEDNQTAGSQDESDGDDGRRKSGEAVTPGLSLTSFLFGNVDENGQLDSDFLDPETKKQLASLGLGEVGCRSLISDIGPSDDEPSASKTDKVDKKDDDDRKTSDEDDDLMDTSEGPSSSQPSSDQASKDTNKPMDEDDDYDAKSPSAVDYSDMNEMVEDVEGDKQARLEQQQASSLPFKMPTAPLRLNLKTAKRPPSDEDDDYDSPLKDTDKKSDTTTKESTAQHERGKEVANETSSETPTMTTSTTVDSVESSHKLATPLAAMLPDKYKDTDVREIFPEFRKGKVLRFSRLFGAGKSSHLPQPWKNVRFKKKRKKSSVDNTEGQTRKLSDATKPAEDASLCDFRKSDSEKEVEKAEDADDEADEMEFDFGDDASPSQVLTDDEDILQRPMELKKYEGDDDEAKDSTPKIADWRFGPAQYWYDFINVPESGEGFDYGLKKRLEMSGKTEGAEGGLSISSTMELMSSNLRQSDDLDPDDAYHLVTQLQWEDDIIWNGEDIKAKVLAKLNEKNHAAGWVPSGLNRTASSFTQQAKKIIAPAPTPSTSSKKDKNKEKSVVDQSAQGDEMWYSIFPVENEELIYGVWEDDIIWDAESMKKIPEPRVLTLDPNDENIVLGIPDDIDPTQLQKKEPAPIPLKEKKEHHLRKSRILLGKAGVIAEQEQEAPVVQTTVQKDPWNISNDEYYNPKMTTDTALKPNAGGNLIQHSIPALELRQPFFPTHMGQMKLRGFHRPPLKKYSHGSIADSLPHSVLPLIKHIKKKAKARESERMAAGGGEIFFMRNPEDLSGKDGDIILCEMSEEHPPLVMQVGMATKIKNYYKRKPGKDGGAPDYEFGETAFSQQSPFLGNLAPGQSLQTLENNLYRAPIYKHDLPDTDFLIIRTRNNYFIREVNTIFTVGQLLPLFEVPGPNSKKANNFIRDFLQVFIYRQFYKSTDNPKRIKMEDVKKAFPSHSESSIRKRLKLCADFKRTGNRFGK